MRSAPPGRRPKGTFGRRLHLAGVAEGAEVVVGTCHRRKHHCPGRRMDADVSMDTDAILVFFVYAQFCVCAIPRYPMYPVSAILHMRKYVQYMQYNHVLRRRSRGHPGVTPDHLVRHAQFF